MDGRHPIPCAARPRVRVSGLWNNNHIEENYHPNLLDPSNVTWLVRTQRG